MAMAAGVALLVGSATFARDIPAWVSLSPTGKILYGTDQDGNRLPDFSTAGFSELDGLPAIEVAARVESSGGDDTSAIQAAIDKVAGLPLNEKGFRGAVQLGAGEFRLLGTIRLNASGVVLRGEGRNRTSLVALGVPRTVVVLGGMRGRWDRDGRAHRITDDYVPVGSKRLHLDDVEGLKVGDRIIVQRPATREWIAEIGMDRIPERANGRTVQWQPGAGLLFDRKIVGIDGKTIELDATLTNAISRADGGTVWKYRFPERVGHVGLESLSASASAFFDKTNSDVRPDSLFVSLAAVDGAWLRDLDIKDFTVAMAFRSTASRITATDFEVSNWRNPKKRAAPSMISIDGQQILISHCRLQGRHFSAWVIQSAVPGPNVVLRCAGIGEGLGAGAHQRWGTGLLLDNIYLDGDAGFINRGSMGSGHGWAGANSVLWNSTVKAYRVDRPPTANNWAFGVIGELRRSREPQGEIISPGKNVQPASLYESQKAQRLEAEGRRP